MADPKGFLAAPRETPTRRPVELRLRDWREVYAVSYTHLEHTGGFARRWAKPPGELRKVVGGVQPVGGITPVVPPD